MFKKIHFLGIGGIGMSALAKYLHLKGYLVSGSDSNPDSEMVKRLKEIGIDIISEAEENLIFEKDVFVRTSAIKETYPLIQKINAKGKTVLRRAEALADIAKQGKQIAVSGTHGKTTTSALITYILEYANLNPSAFIGGIIKDFDDNVLIGDNDYFVLEADEYDRSFLTLSPFYLVVNNIDEDHLDIYKDMEDIKDTFLKLIQKSSFLGKIFLNVDDEEVRSIIPKIKYDFITYGFDSEADFSVKKIKISDFQTKFQVWKKEELIGNFASNLQGKHNVYNCLAAVAVSYELGIKPDIIKDAISKFKGVKRRFEFKTEIKGTKIYDDYAHHPEELKGTIEALNKSDKKYSIFFQPHLYSRTKDFYTEFAQELSKAEKGFIAPVYPAREKKIAGVSSKMIYDKVSNNNIKLIKRNDDICKLIKNELGKSEVVISVGAGDIYRYFENAALEELSKKYEKISFKDELKKISKLKIGNKAKYCYSPNTIDEVKELYKDFSGLKKIIPIGGASNLLFADKIESVLILDKNLPKSFKREKDKIIVSANYNVNELLQKLQKEKLSGLEFCAAIPAHIGGLISMNAGAFGEKIENVLEWLEIIDEKGESKKIFAKDLNFEYRKTSIKGFIAKAAFKLTVAESSEIIKDKIYSNIKKRVRTQPLNYPNLGCFFKNGENYSAGKIIDEADLKGLSSKGAVVSCKHANFILNKKDAEFENIMKVVEKIQNVVKKKKNIQLELEIIIVR